MTLPPIEDLTVHRYDLVKLRMVSPEPLIPCMAPYRARSSPATECGWWVAYPSYARESSRPCSRLRLPCPPVGRTYLTRSRGPCRPDTSCRRTPSVSTVSAFPSTVR